MGSGSKGGKPNPVIGSEDGEHLSLFNSVFIVELLEHIDYDFSVMRKLLNVLSPGGLLMLSVPAKQKLYTAEASLHITLAPQSPSWRDAVGPERTRVRSRTVKRDKTSEAGTCGMFNPP